jgi:hypothetical protein
MTAKKISIKTVEIWMPTVVKSWFGLYKVTKWTHFSFVGGKQFVDGKEVNEFAKQAMKKQLTRKAK